MNLKMYKRDCLLGALGAFLMLVGDLCLSVIPASAGDSGLFAREAYLNGSWEEWRLPLLLATGLCGIALGFFTVRASYLQIRFMRIMSKGGSGLGKKLDREKKPYIYVGMVCVREPYQGQGYMRRVMDMAFAEGNRLGVPVILDTDAKSKCDKYVHLGMELAGTRRFGEYGVLYDLIKYPDRSDPEENRRSAK